MSADAEIWSAGTFGSAISDFLQGNQSATVQIPPEPFLFPIAKASSPARFFKRSACLRG